MHKTSKSRGLVPVLLRLLATGLLWGAAVEGQAATATLCAEAYTQALPGAPAVPMWGYRLVADAAACSTSGAPASPGPVISVPAGDATLAITLVNKLTVPTSIVLAGQALASDGGAPVNAADLVGPGCAPVPANLLTCRVRSFTGETDPGATRTYTFTNLRPGSYLYQSGTHPQVQVQMGLFGLAKQDAQAAGSTARQLSVNPANGFDVDVSVVLSEIDPEQHQLIASTLGTAGQQTQWQLGKNSTLKYAPKFYLINGKVFDSTDPTASDLPVGAGAGSRVVLRLANAGLVSRILMLNNGTWKLLAEDGNAYAAAREQATALLPAGKTTDALLISTAPSDGSTSRSVAIFDRRGGTDNADGSSLGGQVARLAQAGLAVPLIAPVLAQVANEGGLFSLQLQSTNVASYLLTGPAGMVVSASGLITWAAPLGTAVPTNLPVTVVGAGTGGSAATVNFNVRVNHRPTIAATAPVAVRHGAVTIAAPGVLTGATDPDGDTPLTAVVTTAASAGALTVNADGSYSWSGAQPATGTAAVSFGVASRDPFGLVSAPTAVTLNVAANVPPAAVNDAYPITLARVGVIARSVVDPLQITALTRPVTLLTANDSDADGTLNPASIARVVPVGGATARRINPNSPVGCTTNCVTIAPGPLQAQASVTFNVVAGNFILVPHTIFSLPTVAVGTPQVYEFRYTINDDQGATSNQAVVRVTVN
jgi:Bacterial cadherin-like domain